MTTDFDWSPQGEVWWRAQADLARASELQLRFACSFSKCGNATEAARQAGYAGDDEGLRQAGYGAKHSRAVETLLGAIANADGGPVTRAELRRHFERIVRTGTVPDRLRAGEMLLKLDALDAEDAVRKTMNGDPAHTLARIREMDTMIADILAKRFGLNGAGTGELV